MPTHQSWSHPVPPVGEAERRERLARLREAMDAAGHAGLLLGSTESLRYFTGLVWHPSERFCGALVTRDRLTFVVPGFEGSRVDSLPHLSGDVALWQEDEEPAELVARLVGPAGVLALDEQIPLFQYHRFAQALGRDRLADAGPVVSALRMIKSPAEIALIRHAMGITLEVQAAARAAMRPGVRASEIVALIDAEHRRRGADDGSTFAIVSFGEATALPHGADGDQILAVGDLILVDTGCRLDGYHSDLTRTYTLEEPPAEIARIWAIEREAQEAAFAAARPGAPCSAPDEAARRVIEAHGLGPGYALPGLPHRTGHGLGLEIHEPPFIVGGSRQLLAAGMCFSIEPMIVVPGRFGVRLEDHVHVTETGAAWFTQPARTPFEAP
ncbi:M24 family metallopeptidase [Antarcticirhabdus aurantiaca]|uniref:Xaa-Pro peptidase family protein n=1 Tax=Antarcticirhabdus aurantiaca TaxID=2606717 RepID=A0ACD4NJM1_9HYPH|nr:Xaa-Pro peptidase family protein [Antarcticirhabdus aurantiaca]WAJ27029.1 Xaa-Pro peptidase family protein [Jeongeuplla avenae]